MLAVFLLCSGNFTENFHQIHSFIVLVDCLCTWQLQLILSDLSNLSTEELNPSQVVRTLLPLLLESSTESVAEISSTSLERILGPSESDAFLARIYERLVTGCYNIIANHSDPNRYDMSKYCLIFY